MAEQLDADLRTIAVTWQMRRDEMARRNGVAHSPLAIGQQPVKAGDFTRTLNACTRQLLSRLGADWTPEEWEAFCELVTNARVHKGILD